MFSLSADSTAEMLNVRIEFRCLVPSNIYDPLFKAARKKQWCLGAGRGGVTNIFVIYLGGGGSRIIFQRDWGGIVKFFAHHMKM